MKYVTTTILMSLFFFSSTLAQNENALQLAKEEIMATNESHVTAYVKSACAEPFGDRCGRIPYFSHPDITYLGTPIGETDPAGIDGAMNEVIIINLKSLINGFRDYLVNHEVGFDVMINKEFVNSVAQNEWKNLGLFEGQAGAQIHLRSENLVELKTGMHMQSGTFFEARISSACDPPDVNIIGVEVLTRKE